jgi:predicted ATPase
MSDPTMTPSPHAPEPPDPETPEREPFLKRIRLENFLSFGPDSGWIDLKSLNVLIGPNGAGKSNFIEALQILKSLPVDLTRVISSGSRAAQYPWKGSRDVSACGLGTIWQYGQSAFDLLHSIRLTAEADVFGVTSETLQSVIEHPTESGKEGFRHRVLFGYYSGSPELSLIHDAARSKSEIDADLPIGRIPPGQSVLSQRKDPNSYPEVFYLTENLSRIRVFRFSDLDCGINLKRGQSSDEPLGDFLNEYATNLAKTLQDFNRYEGVLEALNERLREFLPTFRKFHVHPGMNSFELQVLEEGFKQPIPAARLSDGTLRYLVLLVILLHPDPPPLICIEEPEIGLHPDMISEVGRLLRDASTRTQLIVTTHSDVLIDALSGVPETVVVCEKEDGITQMERLSLQELDVWLADYSLGHLWRKGTIGGNRW